MVVLGLRHQSHCITRILPITFPWLLPILELNFIHNRCGGYDIQVFKNRL